MFYFYKNHINRYIWSQFIHFFWRNIFIRLSIIKIKSLEISIFINIIFNNKIFANYFKLYTIYHFKNEKEFVKKIHIRVYFAKLCNRSKCFQKKKGKFLAIFRFISTLYNDCSIFIKAYLIHKLCILNR